jgi:hypothetical protein
MRESVMLLYDDPGSPIDHPEALVRDWLRAAAATHN